MGAPAMTPPAAGWDAEAAARELEREWMLASSLAEQRAIIARHLTVARSTVPSAEAMQWQPIVTAPRDGTIVLLWWPHWNNLRPIIGCYHLEMWIASERLSDGPDPTHWMPLPVAPDTLPPAAARSAEAMRWQLIETATKDETRRLLWAPSMPAPHIGYWDRGWRNNHYGEREGFWYFAEVTHWMPLPAAPAILPPAQPPAVGDDDESTRDTLLLLNEAISLGRRYGMCGQHLGAMCSARDEIERLSVLTATTLPAVRRAVLAALGAGLCAEDAVELGSWLRASGGAE